MAGRVSTARSDDGLREAGAKRDAWIFAEEH